MDSLWFRGGFELETINNYTFLVIKNERYCRLFWMQYWKDVLNNKFKSQTNITTLSDGELRTKVIIDRANGNLLSTPAAWNTIFYYGSFVATEIPPFSINLSGNTIILIYIVFVVIFAVILSRFESKIF